jgi:galactokinase
MLIARAPGRVTLIGDHTDYNQGLSLPMAIDLATEATFTPKAGSFLIGVTSDQFPEPWEIPLGGPPRLPPQAALAAALIALAQPSSGGALKVTSTFPSGAGLSSSAAFSVALLLALGRPGTPGSGPALPERGRRRPAHRSGCSTPWPSGRAGRPRPLHRLRHLESHQVPIPEGAAFVVVHCGTSRELGTSGYADRRAECERAANLIGRPLGLCELGDLSALPDPVLRRRARHVITECARVREVERLLARSNLTAVGAVMTEGHRSLAEDFRVSIPALDELVDRLVGMPGVYGARMTGAASAAAPSPCAHRTRPPSIPRATPRCPPGGSARRRGGGARHPVTSNAPPTCLGASWPANQSPDSAQAACDVATSFSSALPRPVRCRWTRTPARPRPPGRRPGR